MNIGDRVKIIKSGDRDYGRIGTITKIIERLKITHIQLSTGKPQPFLDGDFELVQETPQPRQFTATKNYPEDKCPKCGGDLGVKNFSNACKRCKIRQNVDANGDPIDSWSPYKDFV
jgi:hypothetical protein